MKTSTVNLIFIVGLAVTLYTGFFVSYESPCLASTGSSSYFRQFGYGFPFSYLEERWYTIEFDSANGLVGTVDSRLFYPYGLLVDWLIWSAVIVAVIWLVSKFEKLTKTEGSAVK